MNGGVEVYFSKYWKLYWSFHIYTSQYRSLCIDYTYGTEIMYKILDIFRNMMFFYVTVNYLTHFFTYNISFIHKVATATLGM